MMRCATDGDSSRRFATANALLFSALIGFAGPVAIFMWRLGDADRERGARLIADTRSPQVLPVTAGRLSLTTAEEFAAFYPMRIEAHAGDTVRLSATSWHDRIDHRPMRTHPLLHWSAAFVSTARRTSAKGGGVALTLLEDRLKHCVAEAFATGGSKAQIKLSEASAAIARIVKR